jgi:hypothetical protein
MCEAKMGLNFTQKMLIYYFFTILNFLFEHYQISYAHPNCSSSSSLKKSSMKGTIIKRMFLSIKAKSIPWVTTSTRASDLAP